MLSDSLRSLIIGSSQEEWDMVLPQIMRAYRSTPHSSTLETPNFLVLGRETIVPEHITYHVLALKSNVHDYVNEFVKRMRAAQEVPVEPADRPITPNDMVILQIHEEEAAREAPLVLVDPPPVLATPPMVVESPEAANPPVQLERSQRTRAPPSYLKDFLCDAVEKHQSAIIKEIWGMDS